MVDRGFAGRVGYTSNHFLYQGPYPKHEIQRARNYFSDQFTRSNSRAIRSVRSKIRYCNSYFHKEQIQSVVSESFGAIQVNPAESNKQTKSSTCQIDIHAIEGENTNTESDRTDQLNSQNTTPAPVDNANLTSGSDGHETNNFMTSATIHKNPTASDEEDEVEIINVDTSHTNNNDLVVISDEEDHTCITEETQCLLCDLCSYIIKGNNRVCEVNMISHFRNAGHNSASLVTAEVKGSELLPKYVEERMSLTRPNITLSVYPVCPQCYMIHASIWNCAMHYQSKHDGNYWDVYGLGEVVRESFDTVEHVHMCKQCQQEFPSASKLHKHWKQCKHSPFMDPTQDQIMFFNCMECGYQTQFFMVIRSHALSVHFLKIQKQETITLRILHLKKPSKLNLLPQRPKSGGAQVKSNKAIFQRSMKMINVSKSDKKRFKHQTIPWTRYDKYL